MNDYFFAFTSVMGGNSVMRECYRDVGEKVISLKYSEVAENRIFSSNPAPSRED